MLNKENKAVKGDKRQAKHNCTAEHLSDPGSLGLYHEGRSLRPPRSDAWHKRTPLA